MSLTADWHDADTEQWSVKVTPYYTDVQDYIDAVQWDAATNAPRTVPVVDNFTVLKYANQSAQLYGVDLSADYRADRGTRLRRFHDPARGELHAGARTRIPATTSTTSCR